MTIFGILTMILGFLAMASPLVAGASVALLVGVLMIIGGAARLFWSFKAESFGQGALKFAIGALTLLCGLAMVGNPLYGVSLLTIVLAAYFIVDGLFEIVGAFQVRPQQGWGWLLFGGIVSLLLGLMIWRQFPLSGAWAIGILVGIKLFMAGLMMITVGAAAGAVAKAGSAAAAE
ncbi:MAG: DUF308 domain-containing protein [Thermoanaerobaculia bacterium]|nr:DUF308 domain-containing protein [Thermoanaerobaculia bacterium]